MKRFLALWLAIVLCFTGCVMDSKGTLEIVTTVQETIAETSDVTETQESEAEETTFSNSTTATEAQNLNYTSLNDPELLQYVKDMVYTDVVEGLSSEKYFVENVDTVYISKEYLDELSYNSQENVYFGYTLSDITSEWSDTKYIFTVDENGQTTVQAFEEYDDTYDKAIRNVAIGTGVILVCVTVSVVTGGVGTAPAISMIFAASAKTGAAMALSSGVIGGAATAITCGIEGKSLDDTLKETTLSASEGFMWGAIGGAIAGGAGEVIALNGATLNGLTINEAAQIQKESKYPLNLIKNMHSMEEYEVYKNAGVKSIMVNGENMLIRKDLDITSVVDDMGRTNLKRMQKGVPALDKDGYAYELHHIGQRNDSPLAILTRKEHKNAALHWNKNTDNPSSQSGWNSQKKKFWETIAKMIKDGEIQY